MRSILTLAILLSIFYSLKSQEFTFQKPDYALIHKEIQDSSSNLYYPKLMSRLVTFDTTLTIQEYRHLYYGYVFQKDYEPYWISPDEEKLRKYYQSERLKEKHYDEIIKLATHSINLFPFDLRQMNFLAYIYHLKGDEEMANKVSDRFNGALSAIMSSGDGKTCESAYHVISVSHEYVFLYMFQLQIKQQSLTGNCDYLDLVKNERKIDGIYFNVEKLFESLKRK